MFKSENSDGMAKSHRKPSVTILEEENKDLKNKLQLGTKTMDSLKAKLDIILKKNEELTENTMLRHQKEVDAKVLEAKNLSKKNYWTMALQLKLKNMMSEKMKKLDLDKTQFEKTMLDATNDHATNV